MDTVNAFNVFVQVAETRSFVAAGRILGVSASAVGKSIVRTEERLGVRLFHRSTRSVTLTAEGQLFLERSRRILAEIEAAETELKHTTEAPRGRLRVALPLVGAPFLATLAQFKVAYPDVDLDLEFSDLRVDIIEDGFDAVIRTGDEVDSGLTMRQLGAFWIRLAGSPEYFARHKKPEHPNDLVRHSCIQFRFPNTGKLQAWPLGGYELDPDFQLPPSLICNNIEARIQLAVHGGGIAYLPNFAIRDHLASGRLITVLDDCFENNQFRIMWPSGRRITPKLRVFIDFLVERLFPPETPRPAPPKAIKKSRSKRR